MECRVCLWLCFERLPSIFLPFGSSHGLQRSTNRLHSCHSIGAESGAELNLCGLVVSSPQQSALYRERASQTDRKVPSIIRNCNRKKFRQIKCGVIIIAPFSSFFEKLKKKKHQNEAHLFFNWLFLTDDDDCPAHLFWTPKKGKKGKKNEIISWVCVCACVYMCVFDGGACL